MGCEAAVLLLEVVEMVGVVGNEANDTFGGASEGLGATEVDFVLPVVVIVELDVNATLANGFGFEDCDGCLLLSPPPSELNANNKGLAVVVSAGFARVVNANGFDTAAGASEDVTVLAPAALILLNKKLNDEEFHVSN